jgi:hypothetical protein
MCQDAVISHGNHVSLLVGHNAMTANMLTIEEELIELFLIEFRFSIPSHALRKAMLTILKRPPEPTVWTTFAFYDLGRRYLLATDWNVII